MKQIAQHEVLLAISAEPEFPGMPPENVLENLQKILNSGDINKLIELVRVTVQLTKAGIRQRVENLSPNYFYAPLTASLEALRLLKEEFCVANNVCPMSVTQLIRTNMFLSPKLNVLMLDDSDQVLIEKMEEITNHEIVPMKSDAVTIQQAIRCNYSIFIEKNQAAVSEFHSLKALNRLLEVSTGDPILEPQIKQLIEEVQKNAVVT